MSIRIKLAKTARELEDVFKLRRQVYVEEEAYFNDSPDAVIIDKFDAISQVANLIAYSEPEHIPVGTFRLNMDCELGLPCEETYDFQEYRNKANETRSEKGLTSAKFGAAGMLAISKPFRKRRDVFGGLFRMACDVAKFWSCTHIIATINESTSSIYKNLGWDFLSEKIWIPHIGADIYPVAIEFDKLYQWAFGDLVSKGDLLENFSGCFEWLLVGADSVIFEEGEEGNEAYLISSGIVTINQSNNNSESGLSISNLGKGVLFGEMPLIDNHARGASARAKTNVELVVLQRDLFWQKLNSDPTCVKIILNLLCDRLRETNARAQIYAGESFKSRLDYFMNKLFVESTVSRKDPNLWISKVNRDEFVNMSKCPQVDVDAYLESWVNSGKLEIANREFRFIQAEGLN